MSTLVSLTISTRFNGNGNNYPDLSSAIAFLQASHADLTASDERVEILCYDDFGISGCSDDAIVTGIVTDGPAAATGHLPDPLSNSILIAGAPGSRTNGREPGTAAHTGFTIHAPSPGQSAIRSNIGWVYVDGIGLQGTAAGSSSYAFYHAASGEYARVSNCAGVAFDATRVIYAVSPTSLGGTNFDGWVFNCIGYCHMGSNVQRPFAVSSGTPVYNCTGSVVDGSGATTNGFENNTASHAVRWINNISYGFSNCYNYGSNPNTGSNNASSDATGDAGLINLTSAIFEDYANEYYTPAAGQALDGAGTDQVGALFDTDLTGYPRTVPWDIGALEIQGGVLPTPPTDVDAGPGYSGTVGTPIAIDGASYTPGTGSPDVILWTFIGPGGTWDDDSILSPTFTPDGVDTYALTLTVTNDTGSGADTASLTSGAPPVFDVAFDSGISVATTAGTTANMLADITAGAAFGDSFQVVTVVEAVISETTGLGGSVTGQADAGGDIEPGFVLGDETTGSVEAGGEVFATVTYGLDASVNKTAEATAFAELIVSAGLGSAFTGEVEAAGDIQATFTTTTVHGAQVSAQAESIAAIEIDQALAVSVIAEAITDAGFEVGHLVDVTFTGSKISGQMVTPDCRTFVVQAEIRSFKVTC